MRSWKRQFIVLVAGAVLWSGVALAQSKPADCDPQGKVKTPQVVAGQVVKVDPAQGKLTLGAGDGALHEFQASKETLEGMKVGDRIEAKLREAPKCP